RYPRRPADLALRGARSDRGRKPDRRAARWGQAGMDRRLRRFDGCAPRRDVRRPRRQGRGGLADPGTWQATLTESGRVSTEPSKAEKADAEAPVPESSKTELSKME